jgi:TPP-dependent pyruvate/acetoin dehydrogenase alpha subunit
MQGAEPTVGDTDTHSGSATVWPLPPDPIPLLERMMLIRSVEEKLCADSRAGKLPGNVHPYVGQEAVAVGVCALLRDDDFITSTHRGHGHFLAKGGDAEALVAEVYGRTGGACGGFGGSMHVADLSKGILGANGIVGGGFGIATGAALGAMLDGNGAVAACFFGDGAAGQGTMCEALNVAALWRLPLLLVCEHNGYSEFTASSVVTAGSIAERARAYGVPSAVIDGNDLAAVYSATSAALERARAGQGPSFLEFRTYRTRGHLEAENGFISRPYRSEAEISAWRERDPLKTFEARLRSAGLLDTAALAELEKRVERRVAKAVAFADSSPVLDENSADWATLQVSAALGARS